MENEESRIRKRVAELTGRKIRGPLEIWEDTSQYFRISGGAIIRLAGREYFVTGEATEGRFGIDDQPKFWVKYAVDLESGQKKVLKLVFDEKLEFRVGPHLFPGKRCAEKEARVLRAVRGRPGFMQGESVTDSAGNLVRVIDFVQGSSLYGFFRNLETDHEKYFHEELPRILGSMLEAFEDVRFLHQNGEQHGDIRNDHLFIAPGSGRFVWIDFDYEMSNPGYDVVCMGNVLTCVVGKGNRYFSDYRNGSARDPLTGKEISLCQGDSLLFFRHRIANLRKLFPYIPEKLGRILLRFSSGTPDLYTSVQSLIDDIREACPEIVGPESLPRSASVGKGNK